MVIEAVVRRLEVPMVIVIVIGIGLQSAVQLGVRTGRSDVRGDAALPIPIVNAIADVDRPPGRGTRLHRCFRPCRVPGSTHISHCVKHFRPVFAFISSRNLIPRITEAPSLVRRSAALLQRRARRHCLSIIIFSRYTLAQQTRSNFSFLSLYLIWKLSSMRLPLLSERKISVRQVVGEKKKKLEQRCDWSFSRAFAAYCGGQ